MEILAVNALAFHENLRLLPEETRQYEAADDCSLVRVRSATVCTLAPSLTLYSISIQALCSEGVQMLWAIAIGESAASRFQVFNFSVISNLAIGGVAMFHRDQGALKPVAAPHV